MTQILSRFFKGILFQVWITLCSQEQRQETQNGTRVILHLHRARLNIKGWQRDIGGTLLLGVFLGWLVVSLEVALTAMTLCLHQL